MVPKIIHHIVGSKINVAIETCLNSWKILHNYGYDIYVWNDETITNFLTSRYDFALECFLKARNHGEAADIARYLLIHHFGGHWIDWDVQLLKPTEFLKIVEENKNGYFIVDPVNGTLAAEVFCSSVNNPFLFKLAKDIVEIYKFDKRDTMGTPQFSGPYRMRDSLKLFGSIDQQIIPIQKMFVYDYWEIEKMEKKIIVQPMIHYWLHTWIN